MNKVKLRNFQRKLTDLSNQELKIRTEMKTLFSQLILDAEDEKMALRHVRQAFFQIQKNRVQKLLEERLEFHPFFSVHPDSSQYAIDPDDDIDDDLL